MAVTPGFITSRGYALPKSAEAMAAYPWYNLWKKSLWPYKELREGSTLYWFDTKEKAIVWKSRVTKLERFDYADKEHLKRRLRTVFRVTDFDQYLEQASSVGHCLAYMIDSLEPLRLEKPLGYKFPMTGWLRCSDSNAQQWLASTLSSEDDSNSYKPTGEDRREIAKREVRLRLGQPHFRQKLIHRYGPACMISGCKVLDVIEAAHIQPYRGDEDNHPQNGLLLRSDLHLLFDAGLISIDPKTSVVHVNPSLVGTEYGSLHGTKLRCGKSKPSDAALRIRWQQFDAR